MPMVINTLRQARGAASKVLALAVETFPVLEPAFTRTGQWFARHSHVLGTVYWFAQDDLLIRLRRSGRRFRVFAVAGVQMAVDVTDHTGRLHYFYGEPYEPELAQAVATRLKPGDVFVDVGANIGFFSVLAARVVTTAGTVVAFEPHPDARRVMVQAVRENGLSDRIEIVPAAVGERSGSTRLFLSQDSVISTTDPSRSPAPEFAFDRAIDVQQVTVDDWFRSRPELVARIGAIKIDVEGTEAEVIAGMRVTLQMSPRAVILCETTAGSAADRLLAAWGYRASLLDRRRGDFGNYSYERLDPADAE
jgi:FkbM family methyltransferase